MLGSPLPPRRHLGLDTVDATDAFASRPSSRHAEAEVLADGLMRLVALRLGDRGRRPYKPTSRCIRISLTIFLGTVL